MKAFGRFRRQVPSALQRSHKLLPRPSVHPSVFFSSSSNRDDPESLLKDRLNMKHYTPISIELDSRSPTGKPKLDLVGQAYDYNPEILGTEENFLPEEPSVWEAWGSKLPFVGLFAITALSKEIYMINDEMIGQLSVLTVFAAMWTAGKDIFYENMARMMQSEHDSRYDDLEATKQSTKALIEGYQRDLDLAKTTEAFESFRHSLFEKMAEQHSLQYERQVKQDILNKLATIEAAERSQASSVQRASILEAIQSATEQFTKQPAIQKEFTQDRLDRIFGKKKGDAPDPAASFIEQSVKTFEAAQAKRGTTPIKLDAKEAKADIEALQKVEGLTWLKEVAAPTQYTMQSIGLEKGAKTDPAAAQKVAEAVKKAQNEIYKK